MQLLCIFDVQGSQAWTAVEEFLGEQDAAPEVIDRAREFAKNVFTNREQWDKSLVSVSHRWDIERMGLVDRNILRMALFELGQPDVTPPKVAIDEAIELAKEFGTEESPGFVNGVLDAVWKKTKGS